MAGTVRLFTRSAEETRAVGEALAPSLRSGDVVSLTGDLGAGKTTLVQGAARGLGIRDRVLSPTFTLVREYHGDLPIHHLDIYRLDWVQDVLDLGFEEMIDAEGVVFIEWGDAIEGLLPEDHLQVELSIDEDGESRRIAVTGSGRTWGTRWGEIELALGTFEEA
jgi:tRNA threonylcarbamoyladenosine biosynthesis protein TsaE